MEGRTLQHVVFKTCVRDESIGGPNPFRWQDVTTADLFGAKRIVAFSLPGAFTPTCSTKQCPSAISAPRAKDWRRAELGRTTFVRALILPAFYNVSASLRNFPTQQALYPA